VRSWPCRPEWVREDHPAQPDGRNPGAYGGLNRGIETAVSDLNDAGRRDFRIRNIGFVFQDFELLDYLSILDNILHPYRITDALKLTVEVRQRAILLG
jgi:ABC-type lipoprotein export system ATPase subunit